ncbi:hypothetical protein K438DRAFT_1876785 [Mycena galopus ATCC 62051]|nr:hypothetical protein K438DRAFT_1876785 [Mycena galopus ATCC 62051]
MAPECIAWQLLNIRIIRLLDPSDSEEALTLMTYALGWLSYGYSDRSQWQSALKASQQSVDLWSYISESLPELDNRVRRLTALTIHARNLLESGQITIALPTTQNAVALSCAILQDMVENTSGVSQEDEVAVMYSCKTFFILAKVLLSLDRHVESYEALKEGFDMALKFPVPLYPPSGEDIDLFLDQICTIAERGQFPLGMLEDCIILFCNLACIHPQEFSQQFLWLMHAYIYFSQQVNCPGTSPFMENIQLFLEPNSSCPPPKLDFTRKMHLGFDSCSGIIEDAVEAFFKVPSHPSDILIQNILIAHFDRAIVVFQEMAINSAEDINSATIQWIIYIITKVVPFVSNSNQMSLLQILREMVPHFGTILVSRASEWEWVVDNLFQPIFFHSWKTGLLEDGLKVCEQVVNFLDSHPNTDGADFISEWRLKQQFVLCDMGRFPDLIRLILQTNTMVLDPEGFFLHPYIVQTHILHHTNRHQEALRLIQKGVATGCQTYWIDGVVFQFQLYFLLVELAAAWNHTGHQERALKAAEYAVTACRKEVNDKDMEAQKYLLVHSLTTLSNCLAVVGRNIEALTVAQEAVSIYTENEPHLWEDFLYTIRKQELGGNAFHALSLQLATSGDLEKALLNAEKTGELYCELVRLAPRHLPTLADSLQSRALILWGLGCQDESITICKEAVGIMRKLIDPGTYFLPAMTKALDKLGGYLEEKGDVGSASAARIESAEVQRSLALLPLQPEFLFEELLPIDSGDEHGEGEDTWETASESEGDGEYQDVLEFQISVVEVITEAMCTTMPQFLPATSGVGEATAPSVGPASLMKEHATTETTNSVMSLFTDVLSKPLEMRLNMRLSIQMHSTPMVILWWIFLGIFFAILWRSGHMNLV